MKKSKAAVSGEVSVATLKKHVARMAAIKAEKKALDVEFDKLEAVVITQIGIGGLFEFGAWRCKVAQAWRRSINWQKVAMNLAKILYPAKHEWRAWLKSVVRANRKKPAKPYAKLTPVKEEK
jgi:hypothetical protein